MSRPPNDLYPDEKAAILEAALVEADFDGWSLETLRRAADKAGVSRDLQRLAFPRGVMDLVGYYSQSQDDKLEAALGAHDLASLKVRERIALAVRLRIEGLREHRPAAKRALNFLSLPMFAGEGVKLVSRTVDRIWRACGDQSTDFNYYTKRALLAGVYTTTLLRWLDDETEDAKPTWAFLGRRIDQVMAIEKAKGAALRGIERIPSPLKVLAALRYPDRTRPR